MPVDDVTKIEGDSATVNSITITVDELKGLGFDSAADVQAKLKQAAKTAKEAGTIQNLMVEMNAATKALAEAANALRESKATKIDSDAFDELSGSNLVKAYGALDASDPKRKELRDAVASEYGLKTAMLALEGSELRKAIERPMHKSHAQYEEVEDVRKAWDYAFIYTAAKQKLHAGEKQDDIEFSLKSFNESLNQLEKEGMAGVDTIRKAVNTIGATGTSGSGADWLPVGMSATMVEEVYLELKVAALFQRIVMPQKTYDIPIRTDRGWAYRMPEAGAVSQFFSTLAKVNTQTTGKYTLSAEKLAALQMITDELEQDAILPILDMIRQAAVWTLAAAIEDAVLNGSTLLNDLDNAGSDTYRLWNNTTDAGDGIRLATGSVDIRNAWDGIRKLTNSAQKYDFGNAAPTLVGLRNLRKPMEKYSADPGNLSYVVGTHTHIDLLNLDQVATMEKFGPHATILSGQIGMLDGIPILASQYVYPYLGTTGVFNTTTPGVSPYNRTTMFLINRKGFAFGDRQIVRVEADRQPLSGMRYVLATWRGDFQKQYPSSEQVVAQGINLPL